MRTIRNATFIVLCAMVWLAPTPVDASSSSCWSSMTTWSPEEAGCPYGLESYEGECGDCGDAWSHAESVCDWPLAEVVELWCDDGGGYLRFGCCYILLD